MIVTPYQDGLIGTGESLQEKIKRSIMRAQEYKPTWGAFSGGKDSVTIKRLCEMAGIDINWHYSVTTVDPPELIHFMHDHHHDVVFDRPERPMWAEIKNRGVPPTRLTRWCCEVYKESKGVGKICMGVRWAESPRRKKRWGTVNHMRRHGQDQTLINIIIDWTDEDVWEFHRLERLQYCHLYDEGFKRLGCVLCPMMGTNAWGRRQKERDIAMWPQIARLWKKGVYLCWEKRKAEGKLNESKQWKTPEAMWEWWLWNCGDNKPQAGDECDGLGLFT